MGRRLEAAGKKADGRGSVVSTIGIVPPAADIGEGSAGAGRWRDAELFADRTDQSAAELAVTGDGGALAAWTAPFGVSAALVDQPAPVLAQVPLQLGALQDAN